MIPEAEEQREIEYTCPRCHQTLGRAYLFADDTPNQLRVLIRCQKCLHRWSAIVDRNATK